MRDGSEDPSPTQEVRGTVTVTIAAATGSATTAWAVGATGRSPLPDTDRRRLHTRGTRGASPAEALAKAGARSPLLASSL
jgi:hypothetical protein